jgi:nitrate/TMAO reductase-like tetraheme cytochrome c subunit
MNAPETHPPTPARRRNPWWRNWFSLAGLVIALGSLFSFLLLFILDSFAHFNNPYIGVLTYLVAPGFFILGLVLAIAGALWHRRRLRVAGAVPPFSIDLARPRDRRILGYFIAGSALFLLISAIGSYKTYQFTESVSFCGQTCHTVMKPEYTAYENGPHARVACADCHIGPGASWFVRSKLSGTYQVYATLFDKYPRPIPTPVANLRPAQATCEQCHWPEAFIGNLDRTFYYFLSDRTNTPYTIRMVLKVGGGNPSTGPVYGIHWHMSIENKIEYIATDKQRQVIPWVRLINRTTGQVTVFRTPGFTNDISHYTLRTMDCIDCHNRPAHKFISPNSAVNLALELNQIDRSLPFIKSNAVYVLTRPYKTTIEATEGIGTVLANAYPESEGLRQTIATVQTIYEHNFFPEMKTKWNVHPDNIGHLISAGCTRCHDGNHKSAKTGRTIKANDCNSCHIILAQGSGAELRQFNAAGEPFKHPGGELDPSMACTDCHDGTF